MRSWKRGPAGPKSGTRPTPGPAARLWRRTSTEPRRRSLLAALKNAGLDAETSLKLHSNEGVSEIGQALNGRESRFAPVRGTHGRAPRAHDWLKTGPRERWRSRLRIGAAWITTILIAGAIIALAAYILLGARLGAMSLPAIGQ